MRVTYLGHSSVLLEIDGVRLLTDPLLRDRVVHLVRHSEPVGLDEVRNVDAVLVSHLHHDHFHPASLRLLDRGAQLIVPQAHGRGPSASGSSAPPSWRPARASRSAPFGSRPRRPSTAAGGCSRMARGRSASGSPARAAPISRETPTCSPTWRRSGVTASTSRCFRSGAGDRGCPRGISTRRPRRARPRCSNPGWQCRSTGAPLRCSV